MDLRNSSNRIRINRRSQVAQMQCERKGGGGFLTQNLKYDTKFVRLAVKIEADGVLNVRMSVK